MMMISIGAIILACLALAMFLIILRGIIRIILSAIAVLALFGLAYAACTMVL